MQFIRVSDVANELSVASKDDDRQEFLRYMILSKSVLRDLKLKYINDFKRVFLPIDQSTMIVRIPLDFMRLRTLSLIQDCFDAYGRPDQKVIPLTYNPYINITPVPTTPLSSCNVCNCDPTHPVCAELANYTTLCEEVMIDPNASPQLTGTKQTIIRTCANGDIVKEVSQPTQKFIKGTQQCDYDIAMEVIQDSSCSYVLLLTGISFVAPTRNIRMTINGQIVDSGIMNNYTETNAYFASLGWTVDSDGHYHWNNSPNVYDTKVIVTKFDFSLVNYTINRNCEQGNVLTFPYDIVSYTENNTTVTESPQIEIANQAGQDAFFAGLGFTKVDNTHYTKANSTDVFFNVVVQNELSPPINFVINFNQSNCVQPMINDGITNSVTSEVLCNVTLKPNCQCIDETPSNISTIVQCCAPFLSCCQTGELNNWSGWGYVPDCCPKNSPEPYNLKGTYSLDEENLLIYLDSVVASKVLLTYDNDGSCQGDYAIPDFCLEALKAGLAYRHAQYNEEIPPLRRRELKINWNEELRNLSVDYTDPIHMVDLIGALKTHHTPY
jgi:hypothetical protein